MSWEAGGRGGRWRHQGLGFQCIRLGRAGSSGPGSQEAEAERSHLALASLCPPLAAPTTLPASLPARLCQTPPAVVLTLSRSVSRRAVPTSVRYLGVRLPWARVRSGSGLASTLGTRTLSPERHLPGVCPARRPLPPPSTVRRSSGRRRRWIHGAFLPDPRLAIRGEGAA